MHSKKQKHLYFWFKKIYIISKLYWYNIDGTNCIPLSIIKKNITTCISVWKKKEYQCLANFKCQLLFFSFLTFPLLLYGVFNHLALKWLWAFLENPVCRLNCFHITRLCDFCWHVNGMKKAVPTPSRAASPIKWHASTQNTLLRLKQPWVYECKQLTQEQGIETELSFTRSGTVPDITFSIHMLLLKLHTWDLLS